KNLDQSSCDPDSMTIDNFLEGKIRTCEDEDDAPGDRQATEEKAITWRIFTPEQ
ncbi:unnamed protein product, partial [Durusdinium trenchii]